jgi:chaperonin GroEL
MSKSTQVISDKRVIEIIKKGVDAITVPVSKTFGPEAGTTLMYRTYNRGPRNVDDGFYTSEVIVPKDPHVKLVSEFFKEATMRTNRKVGDGTSATTIVAGALFNDLYTQLAPKAQGFSNKNSNKSAGVGALKKEILKEAVGIKEQIRAIAKPVKDLKELEKIASISLGETNELSKTVAKLAWDVGADGFIDVVEGYKGEVEVERVEGLRFRAKIADKAFLTNKEQFKMEVEDCPVFITNHKLDNPQMVKFLVEEVYKNETKLIFIAPDFSTQVLQMMALSFQNGLRLWPVKVPSVRTEQLEDMAIFMGAKLIDKNKGMKLEVMQGTELGRLAKLIVYDVETNDDAVAIGGAGEKSQTLKDRLKTLKGQLVETKEHQFKMLMERRIASLSSSGGTIRVGSPTDAESLPLKLKIEDVVGACRAAIRGGYVKGGGLCLKEIADKLKDGHILKNALLAPYNQIQTNSGGIAIGKDIIDPADAIYYAVEHATSVVASLITTKTLVVEEPEIEQGEGTMAMAKAFQNMVFAWAKKENILSENEKIAMMDANGGMLMEERLETDNG